MDTRQLAAFCAVVERKSFSQAAERLGVTQPAISLQIRSLERRLGRQLLDRSGRRVEPTEAGLRLYRSAQRLLALEGQLLDDLAADGDSELRQTIALDELRGEQLLVMQEGAGVRSVIEDELRRAGVRLRDFDVRLELGLQESVKSAVAAGFGITFISRSGVEAELAAGTLAGRSSPSRPRGVGARCRATGSTRSRLPPLTTTAWSPPEAEARSTSRR